MVRMIKLRVGIAAAYAIIMLPLVAGMVGYLYLSNTEQMLRMASAEMRKSTKTVTDDFAALINPVRQEVVSAAELVRADIKCITDIQGMRYFHRQLEALPQVFSVYVAFSRTGDFYQILHIPPSLRALGPWRKDLAGDVNYAVRMINSALGKREESYFFYKTWGDIQFVDRMDATYDPRVRPWYLASENNDDVVFSDVYVYASSKIVGITLSQRITTSTGILIGIVGADVTLDSLSEFLAKSRIGKNGRVFILDDKGHLVGHEDPNMGVRIKNNRVELLPATEVGDMITAEAIRQWKRNKADEFEFTDETLNADYMATFSQMPVGDGRHWTIGVLVDKDELIAPLRETTLRIMLAGLVIMIVAILAIVRLSKNLTDPIKEIVNQTDRLGQFDLSRDLTVDSHIKEVHQLTTAVQTMTRSLRSFSVYVPRELVRTIVSGGIQASLSSRRQPMTVMMTDIENYTMSSEQQSPEEVVALLNIYFERMTAAIHAHRGIVDKYIGDAVMALWNAPSPDPSHIENACHAALACKACSEALALEFQAKGQAPYVTRIGLHTGDAVVGNVGSSDRMQYSAIGAMINLTSRLEGLNKVYGTRILVSDAIARAVSDRFLCRSIDRVSPVGILQPLMIHELLCSREDAARSGRLPDLERMTEAWHQALALYFQARWDAAADAFAAFQEAYPADPVARVFIGRCHDYRASPPPEDWDGSQVFTRK